MHCFPLWDMEYDTTYVYMEPDKCMRMVIEVAHGVQYHVQPILNSRFGAHIRMTKETQTERPVLSGKVIDQHTRCVMCCGNAPTVRDEDYMYGWLIYIGDKCHRVLVAPSYKGSHDHSMRQPLTAHTTPVETCLPNQYMTQIKLSDEIRVRNELQQRHDNQLTSLAGSVIRKTNQHSQDKHSTSCIDGLSVAYQKHATYITGRFYAALNGIAEHHSIAHHIDAWWSDKLGMLNTCTDDFERVLDDHTKHVNVAKYAEDMGVIIWDMKHRCIQAEMQYDQLRRTVRPSAWSPTL